MNYLHSHLHLFSFILCLLLKTLASSLHLHLHVSHHFTCLVSLVLDIRINTLTIKIFTTLGTQIFAYGLLIFLQLPLHLLVVILKGKNTVSSLLTLGICGLTLHSWLLIEIHFSGALNGITLDKIVNLVKNTFFNKSNIFISYYSFSLNTYKFLK